MTGLALTQLNVNGFNTALFFFIFTLVYLRSDLNQIKFRHYNFHSIFTHFIVSLELVSLLSGRRNGKRISYNVIHGEFIKKIISLS